MNDPISDILTRIKNGYGASKKEVSAPHSKMKEALVHLLSRKGYVGKVAIKTDEKGRKGIRIELMYTQKKPVITDIVRVSKPGKRVYVGRYKIPRVLGGMGCSILSTPQGLFTDAESRKKGLGGELLCKIW